MQRKYTSFETLDNDLKIAKLERDIDVQRLKNKYRELKHTSTEEVAPKNMLVNITKQVGMSLISFKSPIFQLAAGYLVKKFFKKK